MSDVLAELGCRVLPSVTNFVSFQPPDAPSLAAALAQRGLIVREYDAGPMKGWLRANARMPDETQRLIDALRELIG